MIFSKGLYTTFGLAGAGVGMGMIGEAVGSSGLQSAGTVTTSFVPVAANIHGAAITIGMLKQLNSKKGKFR